MMALTVRILSSLATAMFAAHLLVCSRSWFEGVPSVRVHFEAVLLGVFSGLLIASLVSLIKWILSRFLLSTRNEILVAHSTRLIDEGDEHHPMDFYSLVQRPEDPRREYVLVDAFEVEMQEEMVG